MKLKVICCLLAFAIFFSATALPMDAYATGSESTETETTEETTEATEENTETTEPTVETEPVDDSWHVSDEMLETLKKMEGFIAYAYWDYKQYSIGYGSKCPQGMEQYYQKNPISEEYAEELLRGELDYFEKAVNDFIKEKELTVTQSQYDALVSFSYNCGANWTKETDGYFHKGVLSGNLGSEFVYGMFLWSTAGGQYVLLPRRICETYMYVHGVYEYKLSWYYENEQYRYIFMEGNGGKVNYYVHGFDVNDPTAIRTQFTSAPTGPDENGKTVTYVLDGWYTEREGGTRVDILDSTITSGTTLYAHWKTPSGTPVTVPRVDSGMNLKVTLTADDVNLRSGPQTYFANIGKANKGDELIINEVRTAGDRLWGRAGDQWICLVDSAQQGRKEYTDYNTLIGELFPAWGVVTANGVNVRMGAGTGNSVVGQKNKGDKVLVKRWVSDGERMWGETDEGYIAMSYITFGTVEPDPEPEEKKMTSIAIQKKPAKLQYLHKTEKLDLTGATILVSYSDGSTETVTVTADMVSGFDNTKVGTQSVTVTYQGFTTTFEVEVLKKLVSISIHQKPQKLQYLHKTEKLDVTGATILITFSDGATDVLVVTPEMVSGFDNTKVGENTITVTYGGLTTTFDVEIIKAKVVFKMDDGTVISEKEYLIGDTVEVPENPQKPATKEGIYVFVGWDKEVTACSGNAVYTAVFELRERIGDINKDGKVNDRDAIYLLGHTLFPDLYPFNGTADLNDDGKVNDRDVIYLLGYTLFPDLYPLPN